MSEQTRELVKHVRWMAQTVHQAYHSDQSGSWLTCPRSICASSRHALHLDEEPLTLAGLGDRCWACEAPAIWSWASYVFGNDAGPRKMTCEAHTPEPVGARLG